MSDIDERNFKGLVLSALSFLIARHYVMGTSDAAFFNQWQGDMTKVMRSMGFETTEMKMDKTKQ